MPVNRGQFYLSVDRYPDECIKQIISAVRADVRDRHLLRKQVERELGGPVRDDFFEIIWRSVVNE